MSVAGHPGARDHQGDPVFFLFFFQRLYEFGLGNCRIGGFYLHTAVSLLLHLLAFDDAQLKA